MTNEIFFSDLKLPASYMNSSYDLQFYFQFNKLKVTFQASNQNRPLLLNHHLGSFRLL